MQQPEGGARSFAGEIRALLQGLDLAEPPELGQHVGDDIGKRDRAEIGRRKDAREVDEDEKAEHLLSGISSHHPERGASGIAAKRHCAVPPLVWGPGWNLWTAKGEQFAAERGQSRGFADDQRRRAARIAGPDATREIERLRPAHHDAVALRQRPLPGLGQRRPVPVENFAAHPGQNTQCPPAGAGQRARPLGVEVERLVERMEPRAVPQRVDIEQEIFADRVARGRSEARDGSGSHAA